MTMLDVRDLSVSYGKHLALSGASLSVGRGEIVVILGANGAGKTTLLKAICGISEGKVTGSVTMENEELAGKPPEAIVEAGIALVPEGRGVFGDLSVQENLLLGAYAARARDEEAGNLERVHALFPKLAEQRKQTVRTMSGGEQQMVAIGRAMMSNPLILALDEPSLGLSPLLCKELFQSLAVVREAGLGVLLVEQNAKQSLAIADRGYLLENGGIVHQDTAKNLASDPAVQKAYLGAGSKSAAKTAPAKFVSPAKATPRRPPAGPSPSEIAAAAMKKVVVPASRPQAALPVSGPPNAAPAAPKAAPRSSVPPASGELDLSALVSRAAQMSSRRRATPAQTNGATPRSPTAKPQAAHSTLPAVPMPDLASSTDRLRSMLDEIEAAARRAESYRPILSQSDKRR
jgi:branched-chain amino acid transport system ATP-binding protein